jgi:hypothetical protein
MRSLDRKSIANEIRALITVSPLWPVSILPSDRRQFEMHNLFVLKHLNEILNTAFSSKRLQNYFRLFLAMRWKVIAHSSADYTYCPDLPANIACLRIAHWIANEDESIAKIVMPTITRVIGSSIADVKSSTENEDKFNPHYYLSSSQGDLISLVELFDYAKRNTNHLFSNHLTAADRDNIRNSAGSVSIHYFDQLKLKHDIHHDNKPSWGYVLRQLVEALLASSVKGSGSEYHANVQLCRAQVKQVHAAWSALPQKLKSKISRRRAEGGTTTLGAELAFLFVHFGEVPFTDKEYKIALRFQRKVGVVCAAQIAGRLCSLLENNSWLATIPLPGFEAQFTGNVKPPTSEKLHEMHAAFETALAHREPLKGIDDVSFCARDTFFQILSSNSLSSRSELLGSDELIRNIKNIADFVHLLLLIRKNKWSGLVSSMHAHLSGFFGTPDAAQYSLSYCLRNISVSDWPDLFLAMRNTRFITADAVGSAFNVISETQWRAFRVAIDPLVSDFLRSGRDIFLVFIQVPMEHQARICSLFLNEFNEILRAGMSNLHGMFLYANSEDYQYIISNFTAHVSALLKTTFSLTTLLKKLSSDMIAPFFQTIKQMDMLTDGIATYSAMIEIIKVIPDDVMGEFFESVGNAHIQKLIVNSHQLYAFLKSIDPLRRPIILKKISQYLSHIQIGSGDFILFLDSCPECHSGILQLFRKSLPSILMCVLDVSVDRADWAADIAEKSLALLLSSRYLQEVCPSFESEGSPRVLLLALEDLLSRGAISVRQSNLRKLTVLNEFILKVRAGGIPESSFYRQLIAFFGSNFLSDMQKYLTPATQRTAVVTARPRGYLYREVPSAHSLSAQQNVVRLFRNGTPPPPPRLLFPDTAPAQLRPPGR